MICGGEGHAQILDLSKAEVKVEENITFQHLQINCKGKLVAKTFLAKFRSHP